MIILSLWLFVAPAFAGWDNGNAGDTYTAEFILTARDVAERMKLLPTSELQGIDINALIGAIANTKVHSMESLQLDGHEVDAINYPSAGQILLSRARWRTLRAAPETTDRAMLVLHEYLFMIGVDDSQFQRSMRIIPQLGVADFNTSRWWSPLNPVNKITVGLQYQPEGCGIDSLNFDLTATNESFTVKTTGNCGVYARSVQVLKLTHTAPPSSGVRGAFHRYEIAVFDGSGTPLGTFDYEPQWGQCLLPQDGACRLSGKIIVAGVELTFWMLR